MRVTPDHMLYAEVLLAPQPAVCIDHRTFALSVETIYCKRIELPTITQLMELICLEQYDNAHDKGFFDACFSELVRQRIVKVPLPEIHKLFYSWAATITTPLADYFENQRIAAIYGILMIGHCLQSVTR